VRPERTRLLVVAVAVALAALAVAVAGPVSFVAFLAAPIARRLLGRGSLALIPSADSVNNYTLYLMTYKLHALVHLLHGPVRPWWQHGSSVTYAVAPRASAPAALSATRSACGPPAGAVQPRAITRPFFTSTQPTVGFGFVS